MSAAQLTGGIAFAVGAAACFDAALVWQAHEARRVPASQTGSALLARLLRRPRWLAATALAALGWPLQLAALALAPLTLVQPTLASGLIVVLVLGRRVLPDPVGRLEIGGAAAIIAGVALLAWAAPERHTVVGDPASLAATLGALGAIAIVPGLVRGGAHGSLSMLGAGSAFAFTALTSKLLSDALAAGNGPALVVYALLTAAFAGLGVLDEMSALQRLPATRVAPVVLVIQVIAPVLLAPFVAAEHWTSGPAGGAWVLLGLTIVAAGALPLASARQVSALTSQASTAG